jgi:hypothetical protein
LLEKTNTFIGTGKSFTLSEIISRLKEKHYGAHYDMLPDAEQALVRSRLAIAASTGIAAVPIGGRTLYSGTYSFH